MITEVSTMEESAPGTMTQAIIDFLILHIPIFSALKSKELRSIEECMKMLEVIPGEIVFNESSS
jgi:hypothetical protein